MSALNWITASARGKRQTRIERKRLRRESQVETHPVAPDENGCYGWPRACSHYDDLECLEAEDA